MRGTRLGAVAVLAAATVLTGCTAGPPSSAQRVYDRAAVPAGEIKLGGAVMAFFVGQQIADMSNAIVELHKPGYLVLVDPDGSFRTLKTKRMDMMKPVWSDNGLFFSDEDSDYHLTASGLNTIKSPKSNAQNLMFATPTGSVGVYNGFGEDGGGYLNQVVVTDGNSSRMYKVQGNYFTGARCGDQIFGIATDLGTHQGEASKIPGMAHPEQHPEMLVRLYPLAADGGEKVVAWRSVFEPGEVAGEAACRDGVMTFLSWDGDGNGNMGPMIVSWNTRTGDHQSHALDFGDATKVSGDDINTAVQDLNMTDGQLNWVLADGRAFSTDSKTGKTTKRFTATIDPVAGRRPNTLFGFSDTELYALSTFHEADGDIRFTVFSRTDGRVLRSVSIPIPNRDINVSFLALSSSITVR